MAKDRNNRTLGKSRSSVRNQRIAESEFSWRKGNLFYHCFTVNGIRYTESDKSPHKAKELAAKKAGIELKIEEEVLV